MALPATINCDVSVVEVLYGAQEYLWWEWGEWALPALPLRLMQYLWCEFILSPDVLLVRISSLAHCCNVHSVSSRSSGCRNTHQAPIATHCQNKLWLGGYEEELRVSRGMLPMPRWAALTSHNMKKVPCGPSVDVPLLYA